MQIVPPDLESTAGSFSPTERAIFAYGLASNQGDYCGDPLAIEARYGEIIAAKNPEAIGQWLRRDSLSHRLLGLRRLVPVIHEAFALPKFSEKCPEGLTATDANRLLERFFGYMDDLAVKYRREADLLATSGPLPGRVHTYEREVGLWLNRGRCQALPAVAHWRGAIAASGAAQAHFSLIDAMSGSLAEAYELADKIEGDRQVALAQAQSAAARGGHG